MTLVSPVSGLSTGAPALAVMIDGENIPVRHAGTILTHAARQGRPCIRRVYGNATLTGGWDGEPGVDLVHTHSGKNSADMKLAIDTVDLAARGLAQRFVIVSSDADFTHLARYLRERGYGVTGIGEAKTPEAFRKACTEFVILTDAPVAADDMPAPPPVLRQTELTDVLKGMPLHRAVAEILRCERGAGWTEIASLNALVRRHIDIRIKTKPEKNWNGFLLKYANLFECDGKKASRRVRLRANR